MRFWSYVACAVRGNISLKGSAVCPTATGPLLAGLRSVRRIGGCAVRHSQREESSTQNAVGLEWKCHVHFEGTLRARLGKLSALCS